VNRDERSLFRSFITASPYIEKVEQEVFVGNISAEGLASCLASNGISVSLASNTAWDRPWVIGSLISLDDGADIAESKVAIRNVANLHHWVDHSDSIRNQQKSCLTAGREIIHWRETVFPHLLFGDGAVDQLQALTGNERYFDWILTALFAAETEVANWTSGPFPHGRLPGPASGESQTVNDSPRLRNMRMFPTDSGIEYCEHHMKCGGANQRIHYLLRTGTRRGMVIGYIGPHLETARY